MSKYSLKLVVQKNIRHMAKVNIKSGTYIPFGGLYFANKAFSSLSIVSLTHDTPVSLHSELHSLP